MRKKTTNNFNQSLIFLNNLNVNFLIRILVYPAIAFRKTGFGNNQETSADIRNLVVLSFLVGTSFKEVSQPEMIIIALDQTQSLAHRKILVDRAGDPINRFD